ncbi:MAG: hypothetical protein Q8N51_02015 [Gammaproteobacteria bacterium]|nr:hypothetical protein [Gammaproteobacteria bacterium]
MHHGSCVAALLAGLVLAGCETINTASFDTWDVAPEVVQVPAELSYHGIPLHSGQIVASEQGSPQSLFLSLLVADPYPWVHTAVLAIEDGVPWIYESQGRVRPSLSGPPNRNIGGGVRRVSLESFIGRQRFVGIYEPPPGVDAARVAAYARERFLAGTPFDAYFDLQDPSKVYCGEFTTLALAAGGAPARRLSAFTPNRSVRVVTDWLEIDTDEIVAAGAVVADARRVALISARHTERQIDAYFDMKDELHRRFTVDQKLGNVLSFSSITMLDFQPEVREYMNRVNTEARTWDGLSAQAVRGRVQALAAEAFGPYVEVPVAASVRSGVVPDGAPTRGLSALPVPASGP